MKAEKKLIQKFNIALKKEGVFDLAKKIQKRFPKAEVYLVGGSVRDIILGRNLKDADILVAKVELRNLETELKKHGKVSLVGQRFAVLKFKNKKGREFDIAIPRKDFPKGTGVYKDLKVKSDPNLKIEEDLRRRDFTINAIAWNVLEGSLTDPFFGLKDLKKKTIKSVGAPKERFEEDYSRMLRAIRFSMQLNFKIEKHTWSFITKYIGHINDKAGDMRKVPYEVIAGEFLKSFDANPIRTVKLYFECGAMKKLMPEIVKMKGCTQPKEFHSEGDVLEHTLLSLKQIDSFFFKRYFPVPPTLTTKIAILLHDVGKPATKRKQNGRVVFYNHNKRGAEIAKKIIDRLKLSSPPGIGIYGEEVVWLIKNHLLFLHSDPENLKKTTIEKYLFNERFSGISHMQLFLADARATRPKGKAPDLRRFKKAMKIMKKMAGKTSKKVVKPLLNGNEVMSFLKIKRGPEVGRILEIVREAQLREKIKNKKEAKEFLKNLP